MFNQLATHTNKVPEPPQTHARAPSDSERAKQPPAPDAPYKPYTEEPALTQTPYEPYTKKPGLQEPLYEPYKNI